MLGDRADIALVGLEILYFADRHKAQRTTYHGAHMTPASERGRRLLGQHFATEAQSLGTVQSVAQTFAAYWFQQIVEGVGLERSERMLVIGGGEDHDGRCAQVAQMTRDFKAIHAGHAHVEQHHFRCETFDSGQTGQAVVRFPYHRTDGEVFDLGSQPLACQRLVIDDEDPHAPPAVSGTRSRTT